MLVFSGPALRRARNSAGRKAEEVALAIGRSAISVQQWERGHNLPTVAALCRLADYLEVQPGELFEDAADDDAVRAS